MQIKKMTYYPKARKLLLPLLVVCSFVICGCGNLYIGEENVFDPDRDETIEEESIPVMVAFSDPYYNILSRGVGKIDPEDEYFHGKMNPVDEEGNPDNENKPRFFVYAFRKNKGDYSITRAEDKEMCLIDGSCGTQADWAREKDPTLEGHGKWAYYNGNGSFINWHFLDDKVYYSNDSQMTPFEFFAYFHDGAATDKATRTADRIFFPVKIDGSQDLMCGTANLTEEQLKTIDEITDEAEKQKIKEFYYSTYTGRRNIWPILKLKHQLAYIKINLIAGNAYGDAVLVNDIKLETHTEGTFVVASKDQKIGATFETGKGIEQLPLRNIKTGVAILPGEDEPAEEETPNETTPPAEGGESTEGDTTPEEGEPEEKDPLDANSWKERNILLQYNEDGTCPPAIAVGELLVPAGNDLVLHTWLSNSDTQWEIEHTAMSLKDKIITDMGDYTINGLVAGKTYNLNLTVYGPKQIIIEVVATPWKNGGDINVDMEEDNIKDE